VRGGGRRCRGSAWRRRGCGSRGRARRPLGRPGARARRAAGTRGRAPWRNWRRRVGAWRGGRRRLHLTVWARVRSGGVDTGIAYDRVGWAGNETAMFFS
jgi:hypothetical protein